MPPLQRCCTPRASATLEPERSFEINAAHVTTSVPLQILNKCADIQAHISEGSTSFLFTVYKYMFVFMVRTLPYNAGTSHAAQHTCPGGVARHRQLCPYKIARDMPTCAVTSPC
jgi:hypothetical protein